MQIENKFLTLILLQRTSYLKDKSFFQILSKIGRKFPILYKTTIKLKTNLYKKEIKKEFELDIKNDFLQIKEHLPETAVNTLDIGSGMGAINIFLYEHYEGEINIHLLDKSLTEKKIYYGFKDRTAFYNSFEDSIKLLTDNGVKPEKISAHDADNTQTCFTQANIYDVVTSFISWGFHYPIETYLEQVYKHLRPGGVLIIDIRNNTNGLMALRNKFSSVVEIEKNQSYTRICAVK